MSRKRTYHPLVIICFWQGILNYDTLKKIPASTRSYWYKSNQNQLYGYEWIEEFMLKNLHVKEVMQNKWLFRTTRILCRIYSCFHFLTKETAHFKKNLKINIHYVIKTIDNISVVLPLKMACRIFNFTTHKYYYYKNKIGCTASLLNLCFKTHSQQLSLKEVTVIKDEIEKPEHVNHPLATTYYTLLNNNKLACALGTFYKYVFLLRGKTLCKPCKKHYTPLKAAKPFEYLHVDITNVNTLNHFMKVAFIKDNFSKAILSFAVSPNADSAFIKNLFVQTFEKYKLNLYKETITIVSDGGPENQGKLTKWVATLEKPDTIKLTAKLDIPSSNSMSESANYIFKHSYLKSYIPLNKDDLSARLESFLNDYNYRRYPIELYGYTPFEVLQGALPDKTRFRDVIMQAQKTRVEQNHKDYCEKCMF